MKRNLQITGTLFFVMLLISVVSCKSGKHLGIATYSVKGLESDIEGSFKALSESGYTVMEISNYDATGRMVEGYKPADYAALAEKYGLDIISSHARAKLDVKDEAGTLAAWGTVFDDHKAMGCRYVVLPMNFWANNVDTLKLECGLLNKIGEEANKRGIRFGYHNHSMEFVKVPGTDQFYEDFLITNTDPANVIFQMDVFWTIFGKQDPVAYMQKYPDRIKLLHIKDDYIIGKSGSINFEPIFNQFYKNGNEDWFVEMEEEMTPEAKVRTEAMMEMLTKIMLSGGANPFAPPPPPPPQAGDSGQGGQDQQAAPPMPVPGQQDPAVVAQKLKESLDGIRLSAEYLLNAGFVK